ncbi:MAG: hypothetical protein VX320_01075 [Candidatus Thermoplasmatota archaeon]|nr:hypothetical protein [Candidatus Thermoplasmatota archaeon]
MVGALTLGIDVGTSATKVLLIDTQSEWEMHSWPSSENLWSNLKQWLSGKKGHIVRVGITGHGPSAIVIREGEICGRIIPWHETLPDGCQRPTEGDQILSPTRAWVPSRIAQWELENGPLGNGIVVQLKDMLNWQLTGVIARDSRSMRGYSGDGYFHLPEDVIGKVTKVGEELSGIPAGAEVICGCDDLTAGVLGLRAEAGNLFNLANTSEHVGMIGENHKEGMSWLPSLGQLPALCYMVTTNIRNRIPNWMDKHPTRKDAGAFISALEEEEAEGRGLQGSTEDIGNTWRILAEINTPVEEMRKQFPEQEMLIGGGLAMIPQLVKSRGANFRAGQEVSVLGVALLAQKKSHAIIFGAGKVGRGFLSHLLDNAGWEFTLVDAHADTVENLRENGGWNIFNLATEKEQHLQARGILHIDDDLSEAMQESNLLMTSIGANQLETWAKKVREPLLKRLKVGNIDLILAENHPRPALAVRESLLTGIEGEEAELIKRRLGISQAQVLRSCIEPNPEQHPLTIQIQDHWTLPLDGDALLTNIDVPGFEPKSNFEKELTRKLFTYNCVNAVVCYIGHLFGYEWLADAANDPLISEVALAAGEESSAALVAAYGFNKNEQKEWCERALEKYQDESIRDPIERNARDPKRKLGRYDRLLGPAILCIEHDLPCQNIMIGINAALRYPDAPILNLDEIEDMRDESERHLNDLLRRSEKSQPWRESI